MRNLDLKYKRKVGQKQENHVENSAFIRKFFTFDNALTIPGRLGFCGNDLLPSPDYVYWLPNSPCLTAKNTTYFSREAPATWAAV